MASPEPEITRALRTSKRKRNSVSYIEDDYFNDMEIAEEDEPSVDDDDAEDDTFSTRKRGKNARPKKVKKAPKPKKEKPFRFLDLPPELRDEIYELALVEPNGLTVVSKTKSSRRTVIRGPIYVSQSQHYYGKRRRRYRRWWNRDDESETEREETNDRSLVPNLLAVNKQIRQEASSYLYKQEITVEDTTALFTFIATIGPYNRQIVNDIVIRGWGEGRGVHKGNNFSALTILAGCTNLDSLYFDCTIGWYRTPVELARQIYRDGHFFLESYASVNGMEAALKVVQFSDWHFDKKRTSTHRWGGRRDDFGEPEFDQEKRNAFEKELQRLMEKVLKY